VWFVLVGDLQQGDDHANGNFRDLPAQVMKSVKELIWSSTTKHIVQHSNHLKQSEPRKKHHPQQHGTLLKFDSHDGLTFFLNLPSSYLRGTREHRSRAQQALRLSQTTSTELVLQTRSLAVP
jgi:hypothetical protein